MARVALTCWFTITALLGPGVCCCSFANASPITANGQTTSATKPTKSCCQQEVPPCGDNGKSEPGKPSKCPCNHGKQASTLPATASTTADLVTQLNLLDVLGVWLLASFALEYPAIPSASADTSPPVAKLAGRDLLAVYSVLRC